MTVKIHQIRRGAPFKLSTRMAQCLGINNKAFATSTIRVKQRFESLHCHKKLLHQQTIC